MRRVALYEARTAEEVWALIRGLGARTLVFDVEPLVAVWATDVATLDAGVVETLRRVAELSGDAAGVDVAEAEFSGPVAAGGAEVVLFATNSDRRPSALPGLAGVRIGYRASASKPLRMRGYRDLPRPGLVVGDQIATDGALAWRLGFDFVYYRPERDRIPLRPRLLNLLGGGFRPLLFRAESAAPPFR
jgi:hypothetical protein